MNNGDFDRIDLLNGVDDSLVSEAAYAAPNKRRFPAWIAAAAAAMLVIAGASIALPKLIDRNRGEHTAFVPTDAPQATSMVEPTPAPMPTEKPMPTETVLATSESMPTETALATSEPMPTETAFPTIDPTQTETAHPTGAPQPTPKTTPAPSAMPTSEPTPAPEPTESEGPQPYIDTRYYHNFEELEAAIAAGGHTDPNDALYNLTECYVPASIPEDMSLVHIAVTPYYVAVTYAYDVMQNLDDYGRTFLLEWRRNWHPGNAENWAKGLGGTMIEYEGIYIVSHNGSPVRYCIWETGGQGFILRVPADFSNEEIASYCTAVRRPLV